jgi:hypothetical protein
MSANSPENLPKSPAAPAPKAQDARPADAPEWLGRARWLTAVSGLLAGLIAFGFGEATYKLIPGKSVAIPTMGTIVYAPTAATQAVADARNATIAFGALGFCLGGCLGIAGGLARRSPWATLQAGFLGSLLGAALAAGVSFPLLPRLMDARIYHPEYEMISTVLMHGLPWGLAGAAGGLAFAVGLGEWRLIAPAVMAGCTGAVLGALAFDLIGAGLFPFADTGEPIATSWPARLLARLLVPMAAAALVILILPGPAAARAARRPESAAPPGS